LLFRIKSKISVKTSQNNVKGNMSYLKPEVNMDKYKHSNKFISQLEDESTEDLPTIESDKSIRLMNNKLIKPNNSNFSKIRKVSLSKINYVL